MKLLKYIILVTCISFTLVVLVNGGLMLAGVVVNKLTVQDILEMFLICLIIATLISLGYFFSLFKDHQGLYSYFVVLFIGLGANVFISEHFYWVNILVETFFLTVVYFGVWLFLYIIEYKDAQAINKIIGNKYKRNK